MLRAIAIKSAPWLALVALAGGAGLYVQHLHGERSALEQQLSQEAEAAQQWREQYQKERVRGDRLVSVLESRSQRLEDIARATRESRQALDQLEKRDDELRAWMASRLPGAAADWLRNLQQPNAGAKKLPSAAGAANPAPASTNE